MHRLTATLGLLLYRSPFSEELKSFLEVLEGRGTLETKEKAIEGMKGEEKDKKEVKGLIADVKKLMVAGYKNRRIGLSWKLSSNTRKLR